MIHFHSETNFSFLNDFIITKWLSDCIVHLNHEEGEISYIFCDDEYLLKLNNDYLGHDTFTDIISFDYSDYNIISGDIFISIERVKENSSLFKTSFKEELHRVLIHGLLHFVGFKDKSSSEKDEMRKQEDYYLSLRDF